MSYEIPTVHRRRMGWLALAGAVLVFLFWALYFANVVELGQEEALVRAFESAFPIADAVFCVALFAAGYCLLKGKRPGAFFLVIAGSMSVYLGLLDLTFYGARGTYYPIHPEGLFQLSLALICIGAGALALWFGWRFWHGEAGQAAVRARSSEVRDQVCIVTGAASGIGAATARRLADEGAAVVLADIDEPALERRRIELAASAAKVVAIPVDVADPDSVGELVEATLLSFGRVDVLVNCAGVLRAGPTDGLSDESVRSQIDTNLLGTIHTTRALLPYFRRRGRGHFLHVASLGGIVPLPGSAAYCATKFAVRGFCQALALELRETPVRVSVVHPDSTDTPQLQREALDGGSALSFTSRPLSADQVAAAIVKTIRRPRLEVFVPPLRGWLARLAGFAPRLLAALYPLLERTGTRNRERWRQQVGEAMTRCFEGAAEGAR